MQDELKRALRWTDSRETDPMPTASQSPSYKWIALSNTTLGVLMATVNSSILLIALPDIFRGIHIDPLAPGNTNYLLWMILSFLVVTAVLVGRGPPLAPDEPGAKRSTSLGGKVSEGGGRGSERVVCVEDASHIRRWSTNRVEAFSDAVFAIAITLLVLEINVEPRDYQHLARALLDEWPSYLAYVTSFLTVGAVWLAHHSLFARLRFVDAKLMRINIALLMVAAFLPFPTTVLATAIEHSRSAERTAVILYGATAAAIDLLLAAAWRHAARERELVASDEGVALVPPTPLRAGRGAVLYGLAVVLGVLVLPRLAAVGYLLVALRAIFLSGGEGRLTFAVPGRERRG
jgi:TMEM175 potassium channel family protein